MAKLVQRALGAFVPPPVPNFLDLAKNDDGELDVSQWFISRAFRSAELEEGFAKYTFALWRPRIQIISVTAIVFEVCSLTETYFCDCGTRLSTYSGPILVYLLTLPMVILLANAALYGGFAALW